MNPEESRSRILRMPHREPFVFVDEVLEIEAENFAKCAKIFPADDPVFEGHFPGNPIVPGVILTEALAQTAGIAGAGDAAERRFLLSAIRSMKFFSPARPGETVILQARKAGSMGGLITFDVRASVGDQVVAEGSVILSEA